MFLRIQRGMICTVKFGNRPDTLFLEMYREIHPRNTTRTRRKMRAVVVVVVVVVVLVVVRF